MQGDPQLFNDEPYHTVPPEPGGQGRLFDASAYESSTPPAATSSANTPVHNPMQFRMFMTPREIRTEYQALDGDRQYTYDDRAGEMTNRAHTTAGEPNSRIESGRRARMETYYGKDKVDQFSHIRSSGDHIESDDELFRRKLDESQMSPDEYGQVHGRGESAVAPEAPGLTTLGQRSSAPSLLQRRARGEKSHDFDAGSQTRMEASDEAWDYRRQKEDEHYEDWNEEQSYGPSLHDRIAAEGIQSPVHLGFGNTGMLGKPQVLGGHHRLAAQEDIDPDQFIPVKHWKSIHEARRSGEYT
jgi:hypothetical protein